VEKINEGFVMLVRSGAIALCVTMLASAPASAQPASTQGVIKIGDINSHKAMASNMGPYRKGVDLAVEQINAAGGVLGKKLEIVSRDDGANPGDAVRMADELRLREQVDVLTGTILSHVGLAVADYAKQHKIFFLASASLTDKIVWATATPSACDLRPIPTPPCWCRTQPRSSASAGPSSIRTTNMGSPRSPRSRTC
jgi:branched-chain amino acid transport system substrate-binding protein